jgi:hypothetical protein
VQERLKIGNTTAVCLQKIFSEWQIGKLAGDYSHSVLGMPFPQLFLTTSLICLDMAAGGSVFLLTCGDG